QRQNPMDRARADLMAERTEDLLLQIDPGCAVDERQAKLHALAGQVAEWGSRMNLTGDRGAEGIFLGMVVDALELLVAARARLPESAWQVADLGSGAGFPGLPIAIAAPSCEVTLVEARRRRHHFQRSACRSIPIENAQPVLGRLEDVEPQPAALVFAQAVGPLPKVLELALPWVIPGGWLVVPSGPHLEAKPSGPLWVEASVQPYGNRGASPSRKFWMGQRSQFPMDSP
ncbi:16S rRNA (guanine(527)-N(7))-methyltransferase RsmG, partial [Myxococcota bacterium]|nr:16S rRNA (guanine(527)-N(7))-methyltransferase RsmG [Myxococcota bacterium]